MLFSGILKMLFEIFQINILFPCCSSIFGQKSQKVFPKKFALIISVKMPLLFKYAPFLENKTKLKGFSASKCDIGNWIFSKSWEFFRIFWRILKKLFEYGRN
jgi:hypothetical protein